TSCAAVRLSLTLLSSYLAYPLHCNMRLSSRSTLFPYTTLFRSGYNAEAVKILIFAAEGLTKRSAVGFLLRSLIMFQTFISRHNSNFFSDKLVLTSVTPASSAPVLQTPKATSSTLYFDSLRSEERRVGKDLCSALLEAIELIN